MSGPPRIVDRADGAAKPKERIRWLDVTRGIGIILVVYGHAIRGQIASHAYPPTPSIMLQDTAIYAFHMPLFFFLAGLFSESTLHSHRSNFLHRLFWNIVYPYLLWSIIQIVLNIAATRWVNTPFDIGDLLSIVWRPVAQFWFLYALFLLQLLLLFPRSIFYTLASASCFVSLGLPGTILNLAAASLPYFAFGFWLTAPRIAAFLAPRSRTAALGAGAALFAIVLLPYRDHAAVPNWYPVRLVVAAAGTFVSLALGRSIAPAGVILERLGRASLPIYLMHVIAAAALRTALTTIPGLPPILVLGLVTGFALFAPYFVARAAAEWRIGAWLGFGGRPRARLGAA